MTIAAGNRSWTVQTDASLPEAYRHYRYLITTVDTDQEAETGMIIARLSDGMPEETARLLAAAPQMLDALRLADQRLYAAQTLLSRLYGGYIPVSCEEAGACLSEVWEAIMAARRAVLTAETGQRHD